MPQPSDPLDSKLRTLAHVEGTTTLLLFLVAMPLKYGFGMPMAVRVMGSLHGLLFVLYVALVLFVARRARWPMEQLALVLVGAVVPFGTFTFGDPDKRGS